MDGMGVTDKQDGRDVLDVHSMGCNVMGVVDVYL